MATLLLVFYCVAVFAAGILGGWIPRRLHMTHTRTQMMMSLVAGLMLGVASYHMIPHSVAGAGGDIDFSMQWVMAGLVFMLLMLRLFHFHQHDFPDPAGSCEAGHDHHDHDHVHASETSHHHHLEQAALAVDAQQYGAALLDRSDGGNADVDAQTQPPIHSHSHDHDHLHPPPARGRFSWLGLALGLGIHTLIDGVALGAVMQSGHGTGAILGIGVFLAVLLHKPLDALSIETVMAASGWSLTHRRLANLFFAVLCPLAALLFYAGVDVMSGDSLLLPAALAFSAGAFMCIALGDLLPEVQFHSHDRFKLTALFLMGIGLAFAIGTIEPPHFH